MDSTKSCNQDDTVKPGIEPVSLHEERSTPNVRQETSLSSSTQQQQQQSSTNMTKNQMKKLARHQRMLALRPEKRRAEREKKRLRKLELAEAAKKQLDSTIGDCNEAINVEKRAKKKLMSESDNRFKIVIDMDFEEFMTDDEIAKAAKQCKSLYAINRRSQNPCQLYFSSVKGRILDRFAVTCAGYESWDAHISQDDYIDMLISTSTEQKTLDGNKDTPEQQTRDKIEQNLIYLTGDTDKLLPDAGEILKDESKIFIIGGLVDHNRHKNLCYERAQQRQIRTAKLPISENLKLCQRHILSTVTVFDILLNVLGEHKSWRESLMMAIPRRKIHPSEFDENKKDDSSPR